MSILDRISNKVTSAVQSLPQKAQQTATSVLDSVNKRITEKQVALNTPPEKMTANTAATRFAGQTNLTGNREWMKLPYAVRQEAFIKMTAGQEKFNDDGTRREEFIPSQSQNGLNDSMNRNAPSFALNRESPIVKGVSSLAGKAKNALIDSGRNTINEIKQDKANGINSIEGAFKDYANTIIGGGKFVGQELDSVITGATKIGLELQKKILPDKYSASIDRDIERAQQGFEQRSQTAFAPQNEKQRVGKAVAPLVAYAPLAGASEGYIAKNFLKGVSGFKQRAASSLASDLTVFAGVSGIQEAAMQDPSIQRWLDTTLTNAALGVAAERLLTRAPKAIEDALGTEGVKNFTDKLGKAVENMKKQGLTGEQIKAKIQELANSPEVQTILGTRGSIKNPLSDEAIPDNLPRSSDKIPQLPEPPRPSEVSQPRLDTDLAEGGVSRSKSQLPASPQSSPKTPQQQPDASFLATNQETSLGSPDIPEISNYVKQQVNLRESARKSQGGTIKDSITKKYKDFKAKLIDSNAPIEDLLADSKKSGKFEVLPRYDITNQIDRVLRAPTLAGQFVRDAGFDKLIKNVDNLENLDQYLIARHAKTLEAKGIATGRNLDMDAKMISEFSPKYEKYAQQVTDYSRKLLDYSTESGLISKELADSLKAEYPDYVPMNRVFDELEKSGGRNFNTKAVASISSQSVVQKIKGSARQIESPIESLLAKTNDAFLQGEKNKAARILAGYRKLPLFEDVIMPLKEGESAAHKISFLDNGQKVSFEVSPELEAAAKALNVQQIGLLGKIFALPVRIAKLGITGINIPFVGTNVIRDQLTAFINSKNSLKTSMANPQVFSKALWNAIGHGDLYDDMVRAGAGGTTYDITRNAARQTVERIRSGKSIGSKIKYIAKNPGELLRTVEDLVGRSEEVTRLQQFIGTRESLLKQGRNIDDATILAAKAARENTANFYRKGEWGTAINSVLLYLNASKEGARALIRSASRDPAGTAAKIAISTFFPMAATTAWNLGSEDRKKAYKDISEFEKENSLIIVPPNPVADEDGNYNVIKIPLPPGVGRLASLVRRGFEDAEGLDPVKFAEVPISLMNSVLPFEVLEYKKDEGVSIDEGSLASTFTPQLIKPSLEAYANKDFFTGGKIVPRKLESISPELQVKQDTSGTARKLAALLGTSPIKTEKWVKATFGGVGSQVLNISDRALAKSGVIPESQVGGQSISEGLESRFTKARGGEIERAAQDIEYQEEQRLRDEKQKIKNEFGVESFDFDKANDTTLESFNAYKKLDPEQKEKFQDKLELVSPDAYKGLRKWEVADKYPDADRRDLGKLLDLKDEQGRTKTATYDQLYSHRRKAEILRGADPEAIPSDRPKGWSARDDLPVRKSTNTGLTPDVFLKTALEREISDSEFQNKLVNGVKKGVFTREQGSYIKRKWLESRQSKYSPEDIDKMSKEELQALLKE